MNEFVGMPTCHGDVKKLRLAAGLSQNRLARLADLDRSTVRIAESGGDVSELTLSKLSMALSKAHERPIELQARKEEEDAHAQN